MATWQRRRRWRDFAFGLPVALLAGACGTEGGDGDVINRSDGTVIGRVINADSNPAGGLTARVAPASVSAPGSVSTGLDGRFSLRAPGGADVTVTISGAAACDVQRTVRVTASQTSDLGNLLTVTRAGATVAGNAAPVISAADTAVDVAVAGATVTVTATVDDADSDGAAVVVGAVCVAADGQILGAVPLAPVAGRAEGALTGELPLAETIVEPIAADVLIVAADTPGSNTAVQRSAGTITVNPPPD